MCMLSVRCGRKRSASRTADAFSSASLPAWGSLATLDPVHGGGVRGVELGGAGRREREHARLQAFDPAQPAAR